MEGSVPDFPGTGMPFIHDRGILLVSIFDYFCATSWLFSFQRSRNPYVGCSAFQLHQLLSNGYNLHLFIDSHWDGLFLLWYSSGPVLFQSLICLFP